jgi:hypothetical protein
VKLVYLGVADAAREMLDHDLVRPGIGQIHLFDSKRAGLHGEYDDTGQRGHEGTSRWCLLGAGDRRLHRTPVILAQAAPKQGAPAAKVE